MSAPRFLHLKSLKLRNLKGVAELDITFDKSLTLLAGINGVGKTSILQALLFAVTRVCWWKAPNYYPLFTFPGSIAPAGTKGPVVVIELGAPNQSPIEVRFAISDPEPNPECPEQHLLEHFLKNVQMPFPLLVYYEQNRVINATSDRRNVSVSVEANQHSSLQTTVSSPSEFKAWFFEKEADEGQEARERKDMEYADPELEVVRAVLKQLDGFTAIRSRKLPTSGERVLFLMRDGANIPFDLLSGGEQAFFLLAADLARRLMLASPDMPVAKAPGIVCIDEIELHLHPAWQKRILRSLMETFPACQFVVSTHSPQVIAGVEARHVRLLTPGENGVRKVSQPIASKGHDSNYVLKGILDTPERDDNVSQLFDQFDHLVDAGKFEEAQRVLDDLNQTVEGQSSVVAIRQAKLNRLRRTAK